MFHLFKISPLLFFSNLKCFVFWKMFLIKTLINKLAFVTLHQKLYSFQSVLKRWSSQINMLEYHVSYIIIKDSISFSENIILVFRKKIAGYFHPKYDWNIIFSLWFLHIIWSSYEKQNLPPKKPWKMTCPLLSGELILFLKTWYCCE